MEYRLYSLLLLLFIGVVASDTCPNVYRKEGFIVDIKTSVRNGASLWKGFWAATIEECQGKCCNEERCDLALFRTDGSVSDKGHNCYFVECIQAANCVLTEHSQFTSLLFLRQPSDHDANECTGISCDPPNCANAIVQPGDCCPSCPSEDANKVGDVTSGREHSEVAPTTTFGNSDNSSSYEDNKSDQMPANKSNTIGYINNMDNETITDDETEYSSNIIPVATPLPDNDTIGVVIKEDEEETEDTVSEDDRTGGELIALGIIGSMLFIATVIVSFVVIRKVLVSRRHKHFRNVDYLINGIYS